MMMVVTGSAFAVEAETGSETGAPLNISFSDVPAGHTFYAGIMDCAAKGITKGYDDGTFRPANPVTRAQFCVMLSRGFYPEQAAAQNTEENKAIAWFAPNTIALRDAGILKDTAFENYAADGNIMNQNATRYDMAQLMVNIMEAKGYKADSAQKNAAQEKIQDYGEIPAKYQDAVKTVYALGIITGYSDGTFGGWNTMNRGQGCIVIYRMTQYTPAAVTEPGTGDTTGDEGRTETPETPETGTETPATPDPKPETTAGKTLNNGKPVSEANVEALLNELRVKYPEGTSFVNGYTYIMRRDIGGGISVDVNRATNSYECDKGGTVSTASGCGGWAAFVSDYIFGTSGFPARKVAFNNARPGDIGITLDYNGHLTHVWIVTGYPTHDDDAELTRISGTDASTGQSGKYAIYWSYGHSQYDDGYGYKEEIWTRYPE